MKGVTFADDIFDEAENKAEGNSTSASPFNSSSATRAKRLRCPNCGSCEIVHHEASAASICTECGVVVEENALVSSVEFVEGAGGSSSMIGQFVSASSSKAYGSGGGRNGRYGFSRDVSFLIRFSTRWFLLRSTIPVLNLVVNYFHYFYYALPS
jgi:ribosomal protein S27E